MGKQWLYEETSNGRDAYMVSWKPAYEQHPENQTILKQIGIWYEIVITGLNYEKAARPAPLDHLDVPGIKSDVSMYHPYDKSLTRNDDKIVSERQKGGNVHGKIP